MSHAELLMLLQRQWANEITPEELERLEACLRESPQWAAEANLYRKIWQAAKPMPAKALEMNLDEEFERLLLRIEAGKRPTALPLHSVRQPLKRWHFVATAAAVALLVGAILWWVGRSTSTIHEEYAEGAHREVHLPDNTVVNLRQGSKLYYDLATYNQRERCVQLKGEAIFTVMPNTQKPFVVEAPSGAAAEVVGTQFDFCSQQEHSSVLVCYGVVRFWPEGKGAGKTSILLQDKEKARWNTKSHTLETEIVPNLNELVWQTRRLTFNGEPLSNVVAELADYFHVDIQIESQHMRSCAHGGHYDLSTVGVDTMLQSLCNTYDFRLLKQDDTHYALVGGKCPNK